MRRGYVIATGVLAALAAGCAFLISTTSATQTAADDACAEPEKPLRYPDVADVFAAHCDRCHHDEQSDNEAAMRVFESSRYPFATERPKTLLHDLREMFEERSGLSDGERCRALKWLDAGGLDAEGKPPQF